MVTPFVLFADSFSDILYQFVLFLPFFAQFEYNFIRLSNPFIDSPQSVTSTQIIRMFSANIRNYIDPYSAIKIEIKHLLSKQNNIKMKKTISYFYIIEIDRFILFIICSVNWSNNSIKKSGSI